MFRRHKKLTVAVLVAVLATGGAAFAYWTQGGSGTGQATTGTTTAISVIQDSTNTGLFPGGPPSALSGHFDNPGTTAVSVTSVTGSIAAFSSQGDVSKPACTAADFLIEGASGPYPVVSPDDTTTWSGLTVRMVENGANQDNCKSVTPVIDYLANA